MNFPTPVTICTSPKILIYKNVVGKEIRKKIINIHALNLEKSNVTEGVKILSSKYRTSSSSFLNDDLNTSKLRMAVCKLHNFKKENSENFQYVKYEVGQEYAPHYDAFDVNEISKNSKVKQRVITNIIYLNDEFSGGETYFPQLDLSIKPEAGMMISFENCIAETTYLNPFSLHQSKPILSGEKHILTLWLLKDLIH
tara:strand:- start:5173 stop:5763 length:591 start_codon:yes stop_codon:yes gene_type:complete